jgi:hypothetical protein
MSDPDYTSEVRPPAPQPLVSCPHNYVFVYPTHDIPYLQSQTELDEEFARRLLLEDQERQQQAWLTQQSAQRPQRLSPRPYQQQPSGAAPSTGGGDTVGEFQQQFSKIAECEFKLLKEI